MRTTLLITLLVVLMGGGDTWADKVPTGLASWADSETGEVTRVMASGGTPACNWQKKDGTWDDIVDDWVQVGQKQVWKSVRGPHRVFADSAGNAIYAKGDHYLGTRTTHLVKFKVSDSTMDDVIGAALPDSVTTYGATITFWGIFPGVNKVLNNRAFYSKKYHERFEFTQEARDLARDHWGPWAGYRLATATRLDVDSLNLSLKDAAGVFAVSNVGRMTDGWVAATDADTNVFVLERSFLQGPEGTTDIPVRKFIVLRQDTPYLVEMFNPLLTAGIVDGTFWHNASFGDSSGQQAQVSIEDQIVGLVGAPSSNGTVDFIRVYIDQDGRGATDIKCALYLVSDKSLIDTTEHVNTGIGADRWYDLNSIDNNAITSSTDYIICAWAKPDAADYSVVVTASGGEGVYFDQETFGVWFTPLVPTPLATFNMDVLCYYTESAVAATPTRRRRQQQSEMNQ